MATTTKDKDDKETPLILSGLRVARAPDEGEIVYHRNVAEADKRESRTALLADAKPEEAAVPNEERDESPMEVSVSPDFKGEVIQVDGRLWVLDPK